MNRMLRFAALAAPALFTALTPLAAQNAPPQEPFIFITGMGEARVPADRARLDFLVETQAPTAVQASQQNADQMDKVIKALRAAGGTTVTIETGGYNLSPVYRQPPRDQNAIPTIGGYSATNHVRVRADDVTKVGALLDAAVAAGSNRINGLSFEAKDPEPARLEALRAAVAKAKSEAETVAAAMGVTLGAALEVQVNADYGYPPPMPMYRMMDAAAQVAAPTPIEPGEQVVRANVTIRYRLVGR
jgi:uncharacterized protein